MELALYAIIVLYFIYMCYSEVKKQLHMAQLEGYKPIQYWWWVKTNMRSIIISNVFQLIFCFIMFIVSFYNYNIAIVCTAIIGWIVLDTIISIMRKSNVKAKKPLVFTPRASRLFTTNCILIVIFMLIGFFISDDLIQFLLCLAVIQFFIWLVMLISSRINYPIEMHIQMGFKKDAAKKISSMDNLKVIGITGSYGKTSTKYFVKTILSEKYNTLMTPSSFNTPMGITKVIREDLTRQHEVFVCEMGARNIGDIKELCDIAHPSIGIITTIGPQHLATFKTMENIANTKYELIEALPEDGMAVLNMDNEYCKKMWDKTKIQKYGYSIENTENAGGVFLRAENIKVSKKGLMFTIKGSDGLEIECNTKLLGKVNVSNILAGACIALKLGLTPEQIKRGIKRIEPVPHRLQILDTNNGLTVIDDAFNSNPSGSKEALETIKELTGGRKIVITPGMVELGDIEYEENKKFGKIMAKCCDYAILVGIKRTKPILEGLKEENFPHDRIIVTATLDEATQKFSKISKIGDIVLFENDLTDNYNE
ncbi:UDP-N-acetylmuramoyl-tripeptide--D-alanyl-D-alanine ligase [Clostridium fermenticellae]|uniref:UDP-N-acetylmuramoyl-tripeptide--D-alanyl-D-alanine ligase n=1 Tax=Clostridium fermenticellae TaxID=2068654 RepID=A0A386H654_9CLOT|nr:UDP-N-acetylmuramoyl-tripeptide--D-alanyl-D-alanine ligase [Clostridium fermenticellae]AYD41048.1 UDP-N-acetylmuramoyl-tripeptide--D-alanyl-D-alanine ligase [Clostridium fermenticellae]